MRTHLTILLAMLLCAGAASARDWYVSVDGTGDGLTSGSPTQNLVAVCAGLSAGDMVFLNGSDSFVGPGTISAARVSMSSFGSGIATITNSGTSMGLVLAGANNCTLTNLSFACNNSAPAVIFNLGVGGDARTCMIVNCTFQAVNTSSGEGDYRQHGGIGVLGGGPYNCEQWTIRNCLFMNIARRSWTLQPDYRTYLLNVQAMRLDGLLFVGNVVSQYEGVVTTGNSGSHSYRLRFISNVFVNCLSQSDQSGGYSPFFRSTWQGCSYDVSYNVFFNDTNAYVPFSALTARRSGDEDLPNYDVFMNNTFFGFAMITTNVAGAATNTFYNNIVVKATTQSSPPVFVAAPTSYNIHDYTLWWGQSALTNPTFSVFESTHSVSYDLIFVSLDPSSTDFMRPRATSQADYDYLTNGYGGRGIGAVLPPQVPEPLELIALTAFALLALRRK